MLPVGSVTPWPERVVTLMTSAGLVSKLRRRCSGDDLKRLDGIEGNLV